jgi:hypothetical protein
VRRYIAIPGIMSMQFVKDFSAVSFGMYFFKYINLGNIKNYEEFG